ncbi:bone morphogenetic protein receptor type-2-like [Styela clava]
MPVITTTTVEPTKCRSFNIDAGAKSEQIYCEEETTACFASWKYVNETVSIIKQGCYQFEADGFPTDHCSYYKCEAFATACDNHVCCCKGKLCNDFLVKRNDSNALTSVQIPYNDYEIFIESTEGYPNADTELGYVVLVSLAVLCFACVSLYNRKRISGSLSKTMKLLKSVHDTPDDSRSEESQNKDLEHKVNISNTDCAGKIYQGRYGHISLRSVKSDKSDNMLCIKEFYVSMAQSAKMYAQEKRCHSILKKCNHRNIVKFEGEIYSSSKCNPGLALEFCTQGSLRNYLKTNILDFTTCVGILSDITEAISFLHNPEDKVTPPIIHRDVTSNNFLIKDDATVVISDFGLSLICLNDKLDEEENISVTAAGTLNYMAPEILLGTVNMKKYKTSLKQTDVYSTALVMWEVISRCSVFYGNICNIIPASLPYQNESRNGMSIYDIVVTHKMRPFLPSQYKRSSLRIDSSHSSDSGNASYSSADVGSQSLCSFKSDYLLPELLDGYSQKSEETVFLERRYTKTAFDILESCSDIEQTIEEAWDDDEDARLTATSMRDRIMHLINKMGNLESIV